MDATRQAYDITGSSPASALIPPYGVLPGVGAAVCQLVESLPL